MNLKPKKTAKWSDYLHKKIIAVYVALAVVLLVNQIVFSLLLKDREKAKAFSNTFVANLFTNFANSDVQAGRNNVPAAQLVVWGEWITDNPLQTCSYRLDDPGNTCLTPVDFDGSATGGLGPQLDGAKIAIFDWFPPGGNIAGLWFTGGLGGDGLCTDSLTAPTCVYVDSDKDCNGGTGVQTYIIGAGCAGGADTAVAGTTTPLWLHSELINNNGAYDQGEAIWIYKLKPDTDIVDGSYWDSAYLNQWQGDAPGAWTAQDTFWDANSDGKFQGSPNEPVFIDLDQDGMYTDTSNLTYEADGTGSLGTSINDDVIPDGTALTPLAVGDNVCINTLGQGGVDNVIIYVDGNGNCIPGDGGVDVLVRDDTGTGIGVGFGTFPHTYVNAALILRYYDADSSGTWTYGNSEATTETLWARLQGLNQWHSNIEGGGGKIIEADGTGSIVQAGIPPNIDDDTLLGLGNGAPLTYLQPADNVCFSRQPGGAIEDIYVDQIGGDCIPTNDPGCVIGYGGLGCVAHPNILQDNSADGLNPATSNSSWASGAGIFAYFDHIGPGGVPPADGAYTWGANALATESLWLEIGGTQYASTGDANVYGYGSAPLAGDTLTQLSAATGPNGFNLIYANSDSTGTLTSANTILEDEGNVQTGLQNNGAIDRQADILQHITIKNTGTAVAGNDIASVDIYDGGPAGGGCDNPVGSVNDTFIGNLPATGPKTWEATGALGPGGTNGRFCVSINLSPLAVPGHTIILQIPQLVDNNLNGLFDAGDTGWFYYSGNDGATGGNFDLPYTFTITPAPIYSGGRTQDTNPPGLVTDTIIKADSTGKVTLKWKDPSDSDLQQIVIDESLEGQSNTSIVTAGIQTLVLTGRQVGKTYTYKLRSEDTSSNISPAIVFAITIPAQGETEVSQPTGIVPTPLMPEAALPTGVNIGDLVKSPSSPSVYYIGQDKKKHDFPNELIFKTWYENFSTVKIIAAADLDKIVTGNDVYIREGTYLVKKSNDPKCYAIEPNGALRWIENEIMAKNLYGNKWANRLVDLSDTMFAQYSVGTSISSNIHPTASLIRYVGGNQIYYIDNGKKRLVNSSVFSQSHFQDRFIAKEISTSITYPDGSVMTTQTSVGFFQ